MGSAHVNRRDTARASQPLAGLLVTSAFLLAGFAGAGASIAHAFPDPRYWASPASCAAGALPANTPGAEGNLFTGALLDHSLRCSHCHVHPTGAIGATIAATPAFGTSTDGDYRVTTGTRYHITITMTGEHLHEITGTTATDHNVTNVVLEDDNGTRSGRLFSDSGQDSMACPAAVPTGVPMSTLLFGDCHGVVGVGNFARTTWTFDWQAPATISGFVHMWVAMVDGDHGGTSSLGDDVYEHEYILSTR